MYQWNISLTQLKTDYKAFFPARLTLCVVKWFQPHKKRRRISVLTKRERMAFQRMKKDPSIIITHADKGDITTVSDRKWCDIKINKMLDDREIYKHLKTNPTVSTTKDVNKLINNFLETKMITKQACFKLKYLDSTTRRRYGLSKLYKVNIPLRPIPFFTDSPTYGLP